MAKKLTSKILVCPPKPLTATINIYGNYEQKKKAFIAKLKELDIFNSRCYNYHIGCNNELKDLELLLRPGDLEGLKNTIFRQIYLSTDFDPIFRLRLDVNILPEKLGAIKYFLNIVARQNNFFIRRFIKTVE